MTTAANHLALLFTTSCLLNMAHSLYAGIDLGTSGCRLSIIQQDENEVFSSAVLWDAEDDYKNANAWEEAVYGLLRKASSSKVEMSQIQSICISGTSASCLLVDEMGRVTRDTRMYNYNVKDDAASSKAASQAMELIDKHAPSRHTARAGTSSLAKLITWLYESSPTSNDEVLVHQADYVTMKLMMQDDGSRPATIYSDWHNCLKLGYDVRALGFPKWLNACLVEAGASSSSSILPNHIAAPGQVLGPISTAISQEFGLSPQTVIVGGTTDSNAAFFAAAPNAAMGTAVTSLGSTLAMKQLSTVYVEDATRGIYSHRFPSDNEEEAWLVGGASNVGCAVLRSEGFSNRELQALSKDIDPNKDLDLDYYPLVKKGERFPVADANKEPVLEPVPESRRDYLHGILQAISNVERDAFLALGELGASRPNLVLTCGGGSRNDVWTLMRQRKLVEAFDDDDIKVRRAENTEASFGAATLAASSFIKASPQE